MMGLSSVWHWLVVLLVILLVFGTGKLRNLGGDLGNAIKSFKKAVNDDDDKKTNEAQQVNHQDDNSDTTRK